eukprot:gene12827-17200_t
MFERTVTVNGFSKSHSMTGYRIGYSAAPTIISDSISKVQSQITSCASSISQAAAVAGLKATEDDSNPWLEDRLSELKSKRDLGFDLLMKIPDVKCPKPTGAFYLLPDVSYYYGKTYTDSDGKKIIIEDSLSLCLELLRNEKVALVPGDAFGAKNCVRLSYATSQEIIFESITRLSKFLLSLK